MKNSLLFLVALISISCTNHPKANKTETATSTAIVEQKTIYPTDHFNKGEVISSLNLRSDTSQKFALYLPKNYSDSIKFPVIIFFDPHSKGTIPLNLYKDLAEKNNFILISSNSSKNGLDAQSTKNIAYNLIEETKNRFSVDLTKITLCGFSGGAKVALMNGSLNNDVSTIIYCGAAVQIQPTHQINLFGFAGKKDMNYTDLVIFERSLINVPYKHFLIDWKGKHEFPIADVFKDAFYYLQTGKIENYESKQSTITQQKIDEEQSYKQKYIDAFQTKELSWWNEEIKSLNSNKNKDVMFERLLGFISLACYSISNNSLQQNDLAVAEKTLIIYKMADPENEAMKEFTAELIKRKSKH